MRFLIDHGIDMTIKDYRWNSTARGWALHDKNDQKMAQWLEDAERRADGDLAVLTTSPDARKTRWRRTTLESHRDACPGRAVRDDGGNLEGFPERRLPG